jgi:hypothetical protein
MPITQIPSNSDKLVLAAEFPGVVPALLFDYWTKPELICAWWPQKAEVDPRPGGVYHLSWPQMHWDHAYHISRFPICSTTSRTTASVTAASAPSAMPSASVI